MIEVPVIDREGKVIGSEQLDEELLGKVVRERLLKEVVLMYEANRRVGLASTKTRGEVKGSTRKLWRQKGTGRARVGSGKVPHFRGGGVAHGPKPRDFSYQVPKKARRLALKSALLAKFKAGSVKIVEDFQLESPKTREVYGLLKKAGLERSCLFVDAEGNQNLYLSSRNIPSVRYLPLRELNAYTVLRHLNLLFIKQAFQAMKEQYESERK